MISGLASQGADEVVGVLIKYNFLPWQVATAEDLLI